MNSDIKLNKEFQNVLEVLQGYSKTFSKISESVRISEATLTETFKNVNTIQTFVFPDVFMEQIKKITEGIKVDNGILLSAGAYTPKYESHYDSNFEPKQVRIKVVIDNEQNYF